VLINLDRSIDNFSNRKPYNNKASRYLPIGPDPIKDQDLNWKLVYKSIYERLLGLNCDIQDLEQLFNNISEEIGNAKKTRDLKKLAENVYLNEPAIRAISPYTNLICSDKPKARTITMGNVFGALLSKMTPKELTFTGSNFIEEIINATFKSQCGSLPPITNLEVAYLPFLAEVFTADLCTLACDSEWLMEEFNNLIELYSFLYLTQLSLHLGLANQRFKTPISQEVYFILETEKASKERHECNIKGYSRILSKQNGFATEIFSHLGYLELLTDMPIWQLVDCEIKEQDIEKINELNRLLCAQFDIHFSEGKGTLAEVINDGLSYHKQLFKKSSQTSTRSSANEKVYNVFKDVFALNYKSNRKSAGGWYFQLNTKTVLLVTNLIIGENNKMLINDVIEGFKSRGIYFDLKTKNALLKVYENIGNIEKLSDSGDAVYVKSTI